MLRADARVAVEGAEAYADHLGVVRVAAPELRPAFRAELLGKAAVWSPGTDELLAGEDVEGSRRDAGLGGGGGPGPPLAARAVAVARAEERLGHLEANAAAKAPAGQRLAQSLHHPGAISASVGSVPAPNAMYSIPCGPASMFRIVSLSKRIASHSRSSTTSSSTFTRPEPLTTT